MNVCDSWHSLKVGIWRIPEDIAVDAKGLIYVTDSRNPEFKYLKERTDFELRNKWSLCLLHFWFSRINLQSFVLGYAFVRSNIQTLFQQIQYFLDKVIRDVRCILFSFGSRRFKWIILILLSTSRVCWQLCINSS